MLQNVPRIWLCTYLALPVSGCRQGAPGVPLIAPFAADLATDSRFMLDGVDVTDRRAVAKADSFHVIAASTRLLHPQRYPEGVDYVLQILGVDAKGDFSVMGYGQISYRVKPDRQNRVSIQKDFRMPADPGEYEIRIEITDSDANFVVGRLPLYVIPATEPEPDVQPGNNVL